MPTANELLSTEACDDILVVDLESRSIIIPKNVSVLGVEADDETRILHFQIPRYYCNVDLAEFAIRVHYKNAKGEPDMYIVTNPTVEDDLVKFDWIVGRHAFVKKGNVTFSVCLKDLFEGIVRREFNTTIATLPVLEGLETGHDLSGGHTDIFEQLREALTNSPSTFVATYGVTTSAELEDAYNSGKFVVCIHDNGVYTMTTRFSHTKHSFDSPFENSIWTIIVENDTWGNAVGHYFARADHSHNISSMIFLGDNPTGGVDNDTVDTWLELGYGVAWISELNQVNDQPSQYGFIINYAHNLDVFQIFQDQMNGDTYLRCGDRNASWMRSWSRIPTANGNGELIMDGNIKGHYVTGEWLRTVAEDIHRTDAAEKIAVIDGSGWIYYRTPAELRSDMNLYSKEEVDAAIAAAIAKLG